MGSTASPGTTLQRINQRVHDASLLLWVALSVTRAVGIGRAGAPDVTVIVANLVSGSPLALQRTRERRRDPVALVAPVAVLAALVCSVRGGWPPVAATALLQVLNAAERKRRTKLFARHGVSA
jgi:hypothetical protein